ncbi:LysR family transcriptional regulator [Pseudomaricurvus alkylphenolicus]|uniref:LysR family transcriptional regulator n=1 Tax=Pseudomaricurvus alkylphenolicus TaxID=1306991 RepID=UPI001422CED4|nr:LysR family transcriptional regulator [Pseudomaricurvus alkylphenolicus]NIB38752.1 LysR family transcriptional regulator [Pseudomaricurvus alkylphenolicus]
MNLTLKYLRYFVCAAKHGNFTKAAEELHISKSSVITAITNLEKEFGFDLFIRLPAKGLNLTNEGRRVLRRALSVLEEIKSFDDEVSGLGATLNGELTIGCYGVFSPYFMADILSELKKKYPDLTVNVIECSLEALHRHLFQSEIDVLFSWDTPAPTEDIRFEVLRSVDPFVILPQSHPLADQEAIGLRELSSYPMVLFDPGTIVPSHYLQYFGTKEHQPEVILRCNSSEAVRGYVGAGLGFSLLHIRPPTSTTYNNRRLIYKPIKDKVEANHIIAGHLYPTSGVPTRKVSVFMDECKKLFQSKRVSTFFIDSLGRC